MKKIAIIMENPYVKNQIVKQVRTLLRQFNESFGEKYEITVIAPRLGRQAYKLGSEPTEFQGCKIINLTARMSFFNRYTRKISRIIPFARRILTLKPFHIFYWRRGEAIEIRRIIDKEKFDIVISVGPHYSVSMVMSRKIKKNPVMISWWHQEPKKLMENAEYKIFSQYIRYCLNKRTLDASIATSEHIKTQLKKSFKIDAIKINNSYLFGDIHKEEYKSDVKKIGFIGTFSTTGQVERISAIFKYLEEKHEVYIYSNGSKNNKLKKRLCKYPNVNFSNKTSNNKMFNDIDILITPWIDADFGNSIIDAMKYGKPVIAYDIPNINEIVKNNYNGLLVEVGNSREIASEVNRLASYPELYNELSLNASEMLREFNVENVIKKWDEQFTALVSNPKRKTNGIRFSYLAIVLGFPIFAIYKTLGATKRLIRKFRYRQENFFMNSIRNVFRGIAIAIKSVFWNTAIISYRIRRNFIRRKANRIVFMSLPDFSDNSRALFNEMINQGLHKKYEIIWLVSNQKKYKNIIPHSKVIKLNTFKSLKYFVKSKYIFTTHYVYIWHKIHSSKKQIYTMLWHGNIFKTIGKLNVNTHKQKSSNVTEGFYNPNYITVSGEFHVKATMEAANVDESKILISGLPRNDELFVNVNVGAALDLKKEYKKIFLWMPTYRSSKLLITNGKESEFGLPLMNLELYEELNEILEKNDAMLLIKLHKNELSKNKMKNMSNIRQLKNSDFDESFTLYNLIGNVDALLTDYSSVFYDYLLLDRPIGFIYDDLDEYASSRGFIVDNPKDYMPGQHIVATEDLFKFISDVSKNIDDYKTIRSEKNSLFNNYVNNENSLRVLKALNLVD